MNLRPRQVSTASHNRLTFSPEALMSPCTLTFASFICWLKRSLVLIYSVIYFSFLEVVAFNIDINFEHLQTLLAAFKFYICCFYDDLSARRNPTSDLTFKINDMELICISIVYFKKVSTRQISLTDTVIKLDLSSLFYSIC